MLLLELKTADIHRQTQLIKLSNLNKLRCWHARVSIGIRVKAILRFYPECTGITCIFPRISSYRLNIYFLLCIFNSCFRSAQVFMADSPFKNE